MKINRIQMGEALLLVTLGEFRSVPSEAEIEYTFSQGFRAKIRGVTRKSENAAWRVWQTPVKRAVLIAVLIMVMLVTVACATPVIRNAIIDFFFIEDETAYGITFDPYQAASAPLTIENAYIPAFGSEGYTLFREECTHSSVVYLWKNKQGELVNYWQSVIHKDVTSGNWIGIDAEGTKRTTKNINSYLVEILTNQAEQQYVAVWTDNRYIYTVDISVLGSNQETILRAIMDSLVEVETIS